MNRLNIKVRACHVHMGSPSNRLMYLRYHDSAADWYQANERLAADGEWQDFWVSTGQMENAEIVRQSVYKLLP